MNFRVNFFKCTVWNIDDLYIVYQELIFLYQLYINHLCLGLMSIIIFISNYKKIETPIRNKIRL